MSAVQVGSAYSTFELRYQSLIEGVPAIEQQLGRLRQQTRAPISVSVDGTKAARGLQQTGREADQALKRFQALERTFDRTRDSEIRAARASGDHARALQLIDEALQRAERGTVRYNNLLAQQAAAQRAAAREAQAAARAPAPAASANPLAGLNQAAGVFGFGFGAQQIAQYGIEAVKARGELARTENTTRLLTGTQRGYNETLVLARRNQELYGGSLAENISNLTGFTVAARRSGVAVATLNDLSQRLAILSPEQGAEGASIAINEALSGNATSLIRRFEIPRELLKGISDEGTTAAQKLEILNRALNASGVSSDVVNKAVDETTRSVNRASAAFDDLKTSTGEALAPTVELASRGLERIIKAAMGSAREIAELKAVLGGTGEVTQADIDQAALIEAQEKTRRQLRNTVAPISGAVDLVPGAGQLVDALAQSGVDERLTAVQGRLAALSASGPEAAKGVDQLFSLLQQRKITVDEFITRLAFLEQKQRDAGTSAADSVPGYIQFQQAVDTARQAAEKQAETLRTSLSDQVNNRLEAERTATAQQRLAALGEQVAAGLRTSGDAAAILSAQYGFTADEALRLINAQAALANKPPLDPRKEAIDAHNDQLSSIGAIRAQQAKDLKAAQQALLEAQETTAQRVVRLKRELADLNPRTAEYVRKQTELLQAQKQLSSEAQQNRNKAKTASERAAREAEAQEKADLALLDSGRRLLELREKLGRLNPRSLEYKETLKDIKDLETKIADEQERQAKALVDSRLAALDDRKARRKEARELAAAQRVLASGATSEEQKAAARDVLERVPLEQAKRALDIAGKQRDAGGATSAPAAAVLAGAGRPGAGAAAAPTAAAALAGGPLAPTGAGADPLAQIIAGLSQIQFQAFIDGAPAASRLLVGLRGGLAAAQSAAPQRKV